LSGAERAFRRAGGVSFSASFAKNGMAISGGGYFVSAQVGPRPIVT
jgi:hypothetical protein